MLSRFVTLTAVCAASFMISSSVFAADSDPDALIKYRKGVMSAIGAKTNALIAILKGEVDLKDSLASNAEALAASANAAVVTSAFKQNTDGQGNEKTTSTAKIWSDWEQFEKAAKELEVAALDISKAASQGKLTSFDQLKPAFAQCGFCHKKAGYRD